MKAPTTFKALIIFSSSFTLMTVTFGFKDFLSHLLYLWEAKAIAEKKIKNKND